MSILATIPIALEVIDKVLDMFPNYDQRKKEKFRELKHKFETEKSSSNRDDHLVDTLRSELRSHVESIFASIPGKDI